MKVAVAGCSLCRSDGGTLIVRRPNWRLVRAVEKDFPAFYRVIWNDHVREFSELAAADRHECIDAVVQVEEVLRRHLQPTKINVASLGNVVAHLHWHVIARFDWDSHYPAPIWAQPQREPGAERLREVIRALGVIDKDLAAVLG